MKNFNDKIVEVLIIHITVSYMKIRFLWLMLESWKIFKAAASCGSCFAGRPTTANNAFSQRALP